MFVRYFSELPIPLGQVEAALLSAPQEWIPGLAREAEDLGEHLSIEVGFGPDGRRVSKAVLVEIQDPIRFPSRTVLPMIWRVPGHKALFPTLDADLEVAGLGSNRTQLSISARYRPPLGAVGRALDRALMHRVAEATVKDFVDRVGEGLTARASAAGGAERRVGR